MLWGACFTCFHGFLWSGEATVPSQSAYDPDVHLSMSDESLDSATDHSHYCPVQGLKDRPISPGGRRVPHNELCPVGVMLAYIAVRCLEPGHLYRFQNKALLTREALVREVRAALQRAGLDPQATVLGVAQRARQLPDSLILGRWQSSAYQLYVQLLRESLASISSRLGNQ